MAEKKVQKIQTDNRAEQERRRTESAQQDKQIKDLARDKLNEEAELNKYKREFPDQFCGAITFVDMHEGTVWIDRGWADGLERQVSFSVYSGDSSNPAKAVKKASIEVTKVNEHMAMARITDDKVIDPIVQGDKIWTPLWTPGEHKHFALAGFLDLNGDGKNDHEAVKNLIRLHNGVIDCDMDEKGKIDGQMTNKTNYLVCGDEPTDKGKPEMNTAYNRLITKADELNVRKISLADLKERMGYQNKSQVKTFGGVSAPAPAPKAPSRRRVGQARPRLTCEAVFRSQRG